ncbi:hypothetical protein ACTXT7_005561 [Hymenolepis weldensis]
MFEYTKITYKVTEIAIERSEGCALTQMTDNKDQPKTNSDSQNDDNKPPSEQFNPSLLQKATPEYLQELLLDKKTLQNFPNTFKHLELILEKEIAQVRERLFHKNGSIQMNNTDLPDPSGQIVTLQRKVFIPVKENPTYNFVGRLLGPRGLTAKQMEQDLGCKIMVRGKGSMRDKRKEDQNRGKPNWEHLQEELHVLVSVEDYESRAELRLQHAVNAITVFLEQGLRTSTSCTHSIPCVVLLKLALATHASTRSKMGVRIWWYPPPWMFTLCRCLI